MKIVYYKLVKITINAFGLAKIIFNIVVQHYDYSNLIIFNKSLLFILKI